MSLSYGYLIGRYALIRFRFTTLYNNHARWQKIFIITTVLQMFRAKGSKKPAPHARSGFLFRYFGCRF